MPAGQGEDAERFAAAVEQGLPPGAAGDAELARELEIVAMLRSREAAYAPAPGAKARTKERLMAALDRYDAEMSGQAPAPTAQELTAPIGRIDDATAPIGRVGGDDDATTVIARVDAAPAEGGERPERPGETGPTRPGRRSGRHQMPSRPAARGKGARGPGARGLRRRAAVVGTAAAVLMVALTGLGVFASRDALPGDSLYEIKRIAESAGLALTFDDEAKARRHLELAAVRLNEMEQLLIREQAAGADPQLFRSVIREFDLAASQGSRMLLGDEAREEPAELGDLRSWATEQAARLAALRSALPVPVVSDADGSIALLDRLLGRTEALQLRAPCSEQASGSVDDLGPLPADGVCAPRPAEESTGAESEESTGSTSSSSESGEEPSGATNTVDGTETAEPREGLLPGLGGEESASPPVPTPAPPSGAEETPRRSVPLPLAPPFTLPPLLPGMPETTIGG